MQDELKRITKKHDMFLIIPLSVIIILSPTYMLHLFSFNSNELEKKVDFKIYRSQYNKAENQIIVWLDQNGTIPCRKVNVHIYPDMDWSFSEVKPEQFIRITYNLKLNTTTDIPYLREIFIEFEYYYENMEKTGDKILWIIIHHNNIM